jgi:hypothetical protein
MPRVIPGQNRPPKTPPKVVTLHYCNDSMIMAVPGMRAPLHTRLNMGICISFIGFVNGVVLGMPGHVTPRPAEEIWIYYNGYISVVVPGMKRPVFLRPSQDICRYCNMLGIMVVLGIRVPVWKRPCLDIWIYCSGLAKTAVPRKIDSSRNVDTNAIYGM